MQKRLDRLVMRKVLDHVGEQFQYPASDQNAVYRIRSLDMELWVNSGAEDHEVAPRWGAAIVKSMAHAMLYGSPDQVVRFDSRAHYLASFLQELLYNTAWNSWIFEEFHGMNDLPIGRAASHVLVEETEYLHEVLNLLHEDQKLDALLHRFRAEDIDKIWSQGLGFYGAGNPDGFQELVISHVAQLGDLDWGDIHARRRNALRLYLSTTRERPDLKNLPGLAACCDHVTLLHRVWTVSLSSALWRRKNPSLSEWAALIASLDSRVSTEQDWLTQTIGTDSGRNYLASLLRILPKQDEETATAESDVFTRHVRSSFAGLVLLLPILRDLGIHNALSQGALHQILIAAVHPSYQPLAKGDPGTAWLAGLSPEIAEQRRGDTYEWGSLSLLNPFLKETLPVTTPCTASTIAEAIIKEFAKGIRGMKDSSPDYARKQFLHVPGRIRWNEEQIEVTLSSMPSPSCYRWQGASAIKVHYPGWVIAY